MSGAESLPSRAELLALVEAAEHRALTSREAHLLRLGLVALAADVKVREARDGAS